MAQIQSIHDLGATKNSFDLLTEDLRLLRPEKFINFLGSSTKKTDIAKVLKIPRASIYKQELNLPEEFIKDKLIPIVVSADLALEIFGDKDKTRRWMLSPNSYFFGRSPFDMCMLEEGAAVINFLSSHLGREAVGLSVKKEAK